MIKIAVCGASGHMGKNIIEQIEAHGQIFSGGVDAVCRQNVVATFEELKERPDAVIDFSSPAALNGELEYCTKNGVPLVIGTTGFTPEQLKQIDGAAKSIAVFRTANFSLGVNLLCELVNRAAKILGEKFDVEIVEKHHNQKKDAPSGTALMLAESVNAAYEEKKPYLNGREGVCGKRGKEIGIHAVRGGTIVGEHDVMFAGEDEIVTLSHSARSKKVFAVGAVKAAIWLADKPAGMYSMKDILG